MRSRALRRMRARFRRPANRRPDRPASRRSRWKLAPTRSCIRRQPKRPAEPEPASDGEDFASGDVEFARLQLIDKFKPSRHETPAPPRHMAPPVTAPPRRPRSPAPKAKTAAPASAAQSGKRAPREVAPAPARRARARSRRGMRPGPARPRNRPTTAPSNSRFRPANSIASSSIPRRRALRAFAGAEAIAAERRRAGERMGGLDVADHVRRDVLAGLRQRQLEEPSEPAHPAMQLAWGGAAAVLALVLLAQMIHENRAWLAAHGPLRGPLQSLYGALGVKVQPPVNLSAYQLRQWGVTGDPNAAGTLRLRASILNTSAQLQPYPLLARDAGESLRNARRRARLRARGIPRQARSRG